MRWILVLAVAVLAAGCGETKVKTVTHTSTVEVEVPAESQTGDPVAATEDPCASDDGDALAQADTEAQDAFNNTDPAGFKQAVAKAMRAARRVPDGATCAADALNAIASYANDGAGNLRGIDLHGIVRRIRAYEAEHDLPRGSG